MDDFEKLLHESQAEHMADIKAGRRPANAQTRPEDVRDLFPGTFENEVARSDESTARAVLAIAAAFHELDGHRRPLGYMTKGETLRGCDLCPHDARVLYRLLRGNGFELVAGDKAEAPRDE